MFRVVLATVNLCTKLEVPSFTRSKDRTGARKFKKWGGAIWGG